MKAQKLLFVRIIFSAIVVLILSGCVDLTPQKEELVVLNPVIASRVATTPTYSWATATILPTAPPKPSPTATVLLFPVTATPPAVLPTTIETRIPIPTPLGSLPKEKTLWLIETNNGCLLPCWWGIIPGQTEWVVAKEFLRGFAQNIYSSSPTSERAFYEVFLFLPVKSFSRDHTQLDIVVQNKIVERMTINLPFTDSSTYSLTQYSLAGFLTTYGIPSEIWVSTYPAPFEHNELPFDTVLFYPNLGVAALYYDNGIKQNDTIQGCPQQELVLVLKLWSTNLNITFGQLIMNSSIFGDYYLSLEESTGIGVSSFYETFREPDNTICLETPAELWLEALEWDPPTLTPDAP